MSDKIGSYSVGTVLIEGVHITSTLVRREILPDNVTIKVRWNAF